MSHPRIGRNSNSLVVARRRSRQTPRRPSAFNEVLKGGANVLLTGAQAATQIVGLPTVSAALSRARVGVSQGSGSGVQSGVPGTGGDLAQALNNGQMSDDLKLLALQSEIQRHNRQVSLVSNVMKARHDTAKAAITNMRS